MLVYRVFPWLPRVADGESGHPLYVHQVGQRVGRFDNRDLYGAFYAAATPAGAIGESFASLPQWSQAMLKASAPQGATRMLATYRLDEDTHPLVDFNDTNELDARKLRPRDIVERNYVKTQRIARGVYLEHAGWSGITWWSMHRANWTLHMLWDRSDVIVEAIEPLARHPGVHDAAAALGKLLDDDLS
jgi:hypothetical protein